MPSIEVRCSPEGIKRYKCKVRLKGVPQLSKTFLRLTDARRWGHATESGIRDGRLRPTARKRRNALTDVIARYIKEILPHKPRTAPYQLRQLQWWARELGHMDVWQISSADIAAKREVLLTTKDKRGRARGAATGNRYIAALSHVLSVAMRDWDLIDVNPAIRLRKLPERSGRTRYLSDDEINRLLPACQTSTSPLLYTVVVLTLSTGMRRGEVLNLSKGDIDLRNRFLTLRETKNGTRRSVPLTGHAFTLVYARVATLHEDSDLLFSGKKKSRPFDIRKPWYEALRRAGISDMRFHDLRHTAGTNFAMGGMTGLQIGKVLGHKTPAMTLRYTHLPPASLTAGVEAVNQKMFSEVVHARA